MRRDAIMFFDVALVCAMNVVPCVDLLIVEYLAGVVVSDSDRYVIV